MLLTKNWGGNAAGLSALSAALGVLFATNNASAAFIYSGPTQIINVDATTSGISLANGQFAGSTLVDPLQVTFPAGTYTGQLTNPTLSPLSANYVAWSYSLDTIPSFLDNFEAFADNGGSPNTYVPVINLQNTAPPYATALQAYANAADDTFTFTLPSTTTLDFVVPDNNLSDNFGGVSVAISAVVVPEPVSVGLFIAGTTLLLGRRTRRIHH